MPRHTRTGPGVPPRVLVVDVRLAGVCVQVWDGAWGRVQRLTSNDSPSQEANAKPGIPGASQGLCAGAKRFAIAMSPGSLDIESKQTLPISHNFTLPMACASERPT
jgi:hypothetical protein